MSDSWLSPEVLGVASLIPYAIGALIIVLGILAAPRHRLHTARALSTFLGLGLDFLLAAGLIRLAQQNTFVMLGIAASIIVVRRIVLIGLSYGARAEE
jgi:Protein of unknown function (DUF1622)